MYDYFLDFYNTYILMTPVDIPMYAYILFHLLVILPLNLLAFILIFKTRNKPPEIKERLLKFGALAMGMVMVVRYALYILYVYRLHYFNTVIKFEMSEIGMYLLMLSIFVIKKQWFYPLAFTVGLISCIAVFVYPYTVFSSYSPLHLYIISSIVFHMLNGFMAGMLMTARNYVPRLKQIWGVMGGNIILFAIILLANRITGDNFMALSDSSGVPIINNTKPPVNVIIIFLAFNAMSVAVLAVSEFVYKKVVQKDNKEIKDLV